jgi:hypothetical protein
LGAESSVAQAWAAFFAEIASWSTVGKTVTATARATVGTGSRTALSRTRITPTVTASGRFRALLTGPVVSAHSDHGFGGLGDSAWRWGWVGRRLGVCLWGGGGSDTLCIFSWHHL